MSEIRATTVSNIAGTGPVTLTGQYAAKVWVNFNGTGTVAIRESGNVSSITDNSTGNYTVNFTNAVTDTSFAINALAQELSADYGVVFSSRTTPATTTSARVQIINMSDNLNKDNAIVTITVTR